MAISTDHSMFGMTNPKLSKSADALESALAQFSKNATPFAPLNSGNSDPLVNIASALPTDGSSGFDEWLASDFQLGILSGDDASLASSPFSALDDSPLLDLESFNATMMGPSLFDMNLGFPSNNFVASAPSSVQTKSAPLLTTTAAVQQAAAALNIPWSRDLEIAFMAEAANSTVSVNNIPAMIIPKADSVESIVVPAVESNNTASMPSPAMPHNKTDNNVKKRAFSPEEEADEVLAKRAKNTDAARRSRLKKMMRLETLETKVAELETANTGLTMKVAVGFKEFLAGDGQVRLSEWIMNSLYLTSSDQVMVKYNVLSKANASREAQQGGIGSRFARANTDHVLMIGAEVQGSVAVEKYKRWTNVYSNTTSDIQIVVQADEPSTVALKDYIWTNFDARGPRIIDTAEFASDLHCYAWSIFVNNQLRFFLVSGGIKFSRNNRL
ncbi:hypothetical protein BG011_007199 [Mortierella polycephala]|uniref:BZIP domain-containing protein n=1 Tax=Mortierella polycephala TaxID=41804 RepID=A0A9P6PSU4_9FUNG|nr:hypothetical protein BG011_007199 [Mortierella polycephala]